MSAVLPKLTLTQVQTNPAAGTNPVPGSLVTYEITVDTDSAATAEATNAILSLTLGSNLTLSGTPTVSDPTSGHTETVATTGTGFTVTFNQDIKKADSPVKITYTAQVAAGATQGSTVAPKADITYQNASPDEIIYATANNDGGTGQPFFYQYDYTTGTVTTFGTPKAPQDSLAFLGNGDVVTSFKNYNGVTGGIGLYNLTTGVSTQLVTTANGQLDLAVSPDSTKIYYNDAVTVGGKIQPTFHVYDLTTGIDKTLVTSTDQFGYTGITFTPDGRLFGAYGKDTGINATSGSSKIVEIDPDTGAILRKPTLDNGSNLDALRYDPFTGHLFVGNHSGGSNNIYEIDPDTLATVHTYSVGAGSTSVDGINASGQIDGLSADGKGLLFVTSIDDAITVLDINPASPTYGHELHAVSTPSVDDTVPVSSHDNFNTSVTTSTTINVPGSLSGKVFLDDNADGKIDGTPTDAGVSGVTVQLLDSSGNAISGKTTATAADGTYSFSNLTPGNYGVQVVKPSGDLFSPKQGSINSVNSIVDTNTGKTAIVSVAGGANTPNLNAGVYVPASLSGTVFTDQNDNGVKNAGDTALSGQTVQLLDGSGNPISGKTTATDGSGNYSFTNLTPGTYSVKVTPASGYSFSPVGTAASPAVDSIVDSTGKTASVTLGSGDAVGGQNAGEYKPGSLSGHVFFDNNGNGAQDSGDNNLSNVTVSLLDSAGLPTGKTTTTNSSGFYQFTGLVPGQYKVQVSAPSGDMFSPVGTNVDPALDSVVAANGISPLETVASGTDTPNVNAAVETAVPILPKLDATIVHDAATACDGGPGTVNSFHITLAPDAAATDDAVKVHVVLTVPDGLTYDAGQLLITDPNGGSWTVTETATGFVADLAGTLATDAAPVRFDFKATTQVGVTANEVIEPSVNVTYQNASPDEIVYATNLGSSKTLYQFDVTTGVRTEITGLAQAQDSVVFAPDGNLYYSGSSGSRVTIHKFDITTKTDTTIYNGTASGVTLTGDITLSPDGKSILFSTQSTGHAIYSLDTTTGVVRTVATLGALPGSLAPSGLTFDPAGNLYVNVQPQGGNSPDSYILKINYATGAIITDSRTVNSTLGHNASFDALTYDAYTGHLFTANRFGGGVWEIDQNTWQVVNKYDTSVNMDGVSSDGKGKIFVENVLNSFHVVDLTQGGIVTQIIAAPNIDDTVPNSVNPTFVTNSKVSTVVCGGSLSGHVFTDLNADGVQNGADSVLPGVTVQLLDSTGAPISGKTLVTDASGAYQFTDLDPGKAYSVKVVAPANDVFSPVGGPTSPVDSIVDSSGKTAPVTIVSEQDTPNQNAGVYQPASLSGTVFTDLNADGVKEAGDTALSGQTVQLLDGSGNPIPGMTTITDGSGNYSFTNLTPGTYSVKVTPAAGETFSPKGTAAAPAVDSIVDSTGKTAPVTLNSGDNVGGQNAGEYGRGSLSGKVFTDANADGKIDGTPADSGLGGVTVQLLDGSGTPISGKTTVTAPDGSYSFTGLNPGNYSVQVTKPAGDIFSPQQAVTNAVDSIVDPTNGKTAPVAVVSGADTPYQNAGVYKPASLSGTVFTDLNADGVKEAGDTPLAGQTVQLLDGSGNPIAGKTTITDGSGNYSFTNLTPGTYAVQVTPAAGETFSPKGTAASPAIDSIVDSAGKTTPVTLNSGDDVGGQNAGEYAKGSLSGKVFTDANADGKIDGTPTDSGLGGVTVQLLDGTGAPISGKTTVTAPDGSYSFTGLNPGNYSVQVVKPAGDIFSPQQAVTNAIDSIVDPTNGKTAPVAVTSGADTPFQNAGVYAPVSLSGTVFTDFNADGVKESGDTPLSGQTVQLLDGSGTPIPGKTTITDGSGNYSFTNLTPGTYAVQVTPAAGETFSPKGTAASPAVDSIVDSAGKTAPVTLTSGQSATGQNAGEYAKGSLSGKVFTDANADGKIDGTPTDSGLGGVTVQLLDGTGAPISGKTTVTAPDGSYSFTGLNPGNYSVQVTKPAGDIFSPQQAVTNAIDSIVDPTNGKTAPVAVISGTDTPNQNAGVYAPVSLSGTVFTDLNDNGVKNPLDTPVPNVEVDLYKDGVKTALSATTDASGNYSFTNLTPGTYSVQVVKPAADTFSPVGTDPAPAVDSIVDSNGKTAQHTLNSGDNLGGQNAGLFLPQPKLTITKTESISTGQAGDVVTYTVTVAEAAGNTVPAFNVSIADLLAVGETLVKGSETVKGGSGGPDTIVESGTGFTVTAPQLLAGDQPIVVTYQAKLADSVFNNDAITNVAHLGYDSAPAGGLHYTDQDQQTLTTHLVDQFSKSLVTTSQGGGNLAIPGETITFELDATLGKGTQHLVLTDTLPTGLTAISATVTAEGQVITSVPLNTTISPTGNSFTEDFGIVTTPGSSTDAVIKVLVTAKVDTTVPSGTTLTNTATLTSTTPAGAPQDKITSTASVSVVNPGKITGMVFLDGQCDGIFHVGDAGVAGVTVRLLDKAGKPTGITTTTDGYGKYTFDRLIPGQYEVQIVAPQGTDYSDEKNAGTNPLLDSDVDPTTGITDVFTVGAGQTVAGINAGLEFNGAFGGSSPNDIGNGMFNSNSGGNTILGHGGNTVLLGGNGGDIVVLDGKGVASAVEILGSGNEIVTSCGPLQAQTLTSGTGYIFAGNGGSSTLNGSVGDAYLMGGNGNDLIFAGSGHNVLIGGGGTGKVTTVGGVVTGVSAGDEVVAGGLSTEIIYQKGDGVLRIDGSLRSADKLEIVGYDHGTFIKVGSYDALYFGGDDVIVFNGTSAAGAGAVVSYLSLPPTVEKVVQFGSDGKPVIVDAGTVPVPPAPAPVVPVVPVPPAPGGGGSPAPAPSSQTVVLSGYNQVFDYTKAQASSTVDTTVKGSQGFATITVGDGDNTVTASGYGNVIKAGSGDNTINGGESYQKVTVGDGDNTITVTGYTNTIKAGDGANTIAAGAGGETVTVGNGANTITATGSGNVITAGNGGDIINAGESSNTVTVGNGTNTVTATGYNNHITVGNGHNTIVAGAGGETVDLGSGSDTVTLAGWSNLLIGGLGHATVTGGTNNVFQIEGVGTTGGLDVMDFGTTHNDVLDLSKLLSGITLTPATVGNYVSVTGVGSDTSVAVDVLGGGHFAGHMVATLHGAGASSLADLQAHAAIKLG